MNPQPSVSDGLMEHPLLQTANLTKAFGGTRALRAVDLTIARREVHGLVGHNGSGKSTLIKILAGYHSPDDGSAVAVNGRAVSLPMAASDVERLGLRFVHQDLGLIPSLSVAENMFLVALSTGRRRRAGHSALVRDAAAILDAYELAIDPRAQVATLTGVQRANLAIVRAVGEGRDGRAGGLLVLDEPTAFLPADDKAHLYALVRRVVDNGDSVLFVSHFLDEVIELCDRVSVLRDGELVASGLPTSTISVDDLVERIVDKGHTPGRKQLAIPQAGPARIVASGLTTSGLRDVSLSAGRGEILGLTGLLGSGFEDVPAVLFGAVPGAGIREVDGVRSDLANGSPQEGLASGLAFVPADRNRDGLVPSLDLTDNTSLLVLDDYRGRLGLGRRRMRQDCGELLGQFGVRPDDPEVTVSVLSGGNAQKVMMAKWLRRRPRVLLLVEPTQGVDVGARDHIVSMLRDIAAEGTTIICASSDAELLESVSHRVLVFESGRIIAELVGSQVDKDVIAETCLSGTIRHATREHTS